MTNSRSRGFLRGGLIRHSTPRVADVSTSAALESGAEVIDLAARRRPRPYPGPDQRPVLAGHGASRLASRPAPSPRPRPYR